MGKTLEFSVEFEVPAKVIFNTLTDLMYINIFILGKFKNLQDLQQSLS